jgi:hypothetical protein
MVRIIAYRASPRPLPEPQSIKAAPATEFQSGFVGLVNDIRMNQAFPLRARRVPLMGSAA